jgi:hypothetical protein
MNSPKPERGWLKDTLLTLLVVGTLVTILCSWLAMSKQQGKREWEAAAEIENLGGRVGRFNSAPSRWLGSYASKWLESNDFFNHIYSVRLDPGRVTDDGLITALSRLKDFRELNSLCLNGTQVTDAGLEHLKGLDRLAWLWLRDTKVTDAGVGRLKGLSHLLELDLRGTMVTDAGLQYLEGLSQLMGLYLDGTKVTDAGLRHLEGLSQLRTLSLSGTQITDAGLERLKGLKKLRQLSLSGTKATDEGVKNLQRAFPNCWVER